MDGLLLYEVNECGYPDGCWKIQKTKSFCISEILENQETEDSITVFIRRTGYKIACREILYAESNKRQVKIVTGEKEYTVYMKMDQLEQQLPDYFLRTHKSYLVNMNRIESFSGEEVVLKNGISISVSRSHCKEARRKLREYWK